MNKLSGDDSEGKHTRATWIRTQRSAWIDMHIAIQLLIPAGMSGNKSADLWLLVSTSSLCGPMMLVHMFANMLVSGGFPLFTYEPYLSIDVTNVHFVLLPCSQDP